MHSLYILNFHDIVALTTTTAKSSKSSSSSSYTLLFLVVLFIAAYVLFIRPRQQRLRRQQTASRQMEVGDPVVSAGGIHGRIVSLDGDIAEVEVAPGVVMTFLRRAINPAPPGSTAWPTGPPSSPGTAHAGGGHEWSAPSSGEQADEETPGEGPEEQH